MLKSFLKLADDEVAHIINLVLSDPKVQLCIEHIVEGVAVKVTDKVLTELVARLSEH